MHSFSVVHRQLISLVWVYYSLKHPHPFSAELINSDMTCGIGNFFKKLACFLFPLQLGEVEEILICWALDYYCPLVRLLDINNSHSQQNRRIGLSWRVVPYCALHLVLHYHVKLDSSVKLSEILQVTSKILTLKLPYLTFIICKKHLINIL